MTFFLFAFGGVFWGTAPCTFTTISPQILLMILHHPPGDQSSSFWESGQTIGDEIKYTALVLAYSRLGEQNFAGQSVTAYSVEKPLSAMASLLSLPSHQYHHHGYTLDDKDDGDCFSIQVKRDPVYNSPVFSLVAGTTSCPAGPPGQKRDGCQLHPAVIPKVPVLV